MIAIKGAKPARCKDCQYYRGRARYSGCYIIGVYRSCMLGAASYNSCPMQELRDLGGVAGAGIKRHKRKR